MIFIALIYFVLKNEEKLNSKREKEKCKKCGNEIDAAFLHCPYCQEEIKKNCESCGKLIYADWRYCPFCEEESYKDKVHII